MNEYNIVCINRKKKCIYYFKLGYVHNIIKYNQNICIWSSQCLKYKLLI